MRIIRIFTVRRFSAPSLPAPPRSGFLRLLKWLLIALVLWFVGVLVWETAHYGYQSQTAKHHIVPWSEHMKHGLRFAVLSVWNLGAFIVGIVVDLLALLYSLVTWQDWPRLPRLAAIANFFGFGG